MLRDIQARMAQLFSQRGRIVTPKSGRSCAFTDLWR